MQDTLKSVIDITFFSKLVAFTAEHPNSLTRLWSTPARNKLVGGAPSSGHLADATHTCHAADLVFDTPEHLKAGARGAVEAGFRERLLAIASRRMERASVASRVDGSTRVEKPPRTMSAAAAARTPVATRAKTPTLARSRCDGLTTPPRFEPTAPPRRDRSPRPMQ